MKKIKLFTLSLLVILISVTACKDEFLDVSPQGSLGTTELSTLAGLEGSLISAYSILLGRAGVANIPNSFYADASNWFWGSVLGGDANKGTNAGDQSQVNEIQAYSAQTNNSSILQKYAICYEGVARCNATLRLIQTADLVSDEDKTRIAAEARFLRAHYYFDLKRNFNNTPYVDENWDEVTEVGNRDDLYAFIEADLMFAKDNLPATQSDAGRANSWAAAAYLGKVYLFQGKYGDAQTILTDVIENGVTTNGQPYDLVPNYANVFRSTNDNNEESVFAAQAAAGTGDINNANPSMVLNFPHGTSGPERPGGCCGFFQPSFDLANSFRTDGNGLPLLDGSYNDTSNKLTDDLGVESGTEWAVDQEYGMNTFVFTFDPAEPNKELVYKSLSDGNMGNDPLSSPAAWEFVWEEGNESVDPRLDHSIGRRGIPYLDWGRHPGKDWIRDQPYGGVYSPKKFIYYAGGIGTENDGSSWTPGYTALNYNIIRFADVLLMAAEAEVEVGTLDQAAEYVDRVRARAAASPVLDSNGDPAGNYVINSYGTFASQDQARQAVRFERKLELSGEGHRKYDLVRWGVAADVLNDYLAHENAILVSPFQGASFSANQDEFLPIPQDEIDLLGADVLIQNPGY